MFFVIGSHIDILIDQSSGLDNKCDTLNALLKLDFWKKLQFLQMESLSEINLYKCEELK